jgi:hypothetical protein
MTLDDQLKYCKICQNRKLDVQVGLVCSLTGLKPSFEGTCPTFSLDQPEADRLIALEKAAVETEESGGMFATEKSGIKKGMLGGVVMIAIAVVWFFGGLAAGYIFYYPPILFAIGIYALIKGLIERNVAGKK